MDDQQTSGTASGHHRQKLIIAAVLIAIPLIYFYPVIFGQVVLAPGDGWAQNFPMRVLVGQMIARGELPLWNPFIFAGTPLAASVYPGSFYPLNWLFAFLPPRWAMNTVVLATYYLALTGTYLYARRVGINRIGALLAGTAFTFGGFMINHLSHTSRIAAAAWLPWVLLAIESLAVSDTRSKAWKWVALGSLMIALQFLAGEPQMMLFSALICAPFAVFASWRCEGRAARWRLIIAISAMLLVGILLSMIQMLPSFELLSQSERSDPGPAFFGVYSFPPWQLPGLVFPYFFGGAMFPPYRLPYWGRDIPAIMSGYVGMLTWILALVAVFGEKRNARVWLWLGVAVISMILAFGGYLPFGLNDRLYQIPGYKTFRGLYRHQFEFTFAMAVLAGFGLNHLGRLKPQPARRSLWIGTILMSAIVAVIVILYRFFGDALATVKPRPPQAASLANAEFIIPMACFVISLIAVWVTQILNFKSRFSDLILVAVLLIDLASYGHFFHWRIATFDVSKRLADPPAVEMIKSREVDFNSFRVMSYPVHAYDYALYWPEDPNFEQINQPNISVLRGLQSVSGYDILRPVRVGEMMGSAGSAIMGFVQDRGSFNQNDRGLDLLNVKYLIVGNGGPTEKKGGLIYEGISFAQTDFGVKFEKDMRLVTEPGGVMASEIALVSKTANSAHLPDGTPVLKLRLHTRDGRIIERELLAGRDTSEWAYDAPEVRMNIKHRQGRIVESQAAGKFQVHSYLGRLKFDRAEIERIEWIHLRQDSVLFLIRASLHDESTGASTPLSSLYLPPERWQKLARFDQIDLYENLQAMPRAWFVDRILEMPGDAVMRTIRGGTTPEGEKFNPVSTALIEREDAPNGVAKNYSAAGASEERQVKIVNYGPNRIEMDTRNPVEGFLVLSEVFYNGWKAYIAGQERPIFRVNYTLRGINVPAGNHKIEFVYRPQSFRNGAICAALGLILLILIHPRIRIRTRSEGRSRN
jgi:hypothetical protein